MVDMTLVSLLLTLNVYLQFIYIYLRFLVLSRAQLCVC